MFPSWSWGSQIADKKNIYLRKEFRPTKVTWKEMMKNDSAAK